MPFVAWLRAATQVGIRGISIKKVFPVPVYSRNPGCCSWKTSEASGDVVSVLPSPTSRYLRISWSYLQRPFLALFWHHWDITKSMDSGKSCEFQLCSAFGKTGSHVRAGFGCLQGVVVPWGIRAGSLVPVPGDGVGCSPVPPWCQRCATSEPWLLGCVFQRLSARKLYLGAAGMLLPRNRRTSWDRANHPCVAAAGVKTCGHPGWGRLWSSFSSLTPVWFLDLQRSCCCSAPCSKFAYQMESHSFGC